MYGSFCASPMIPAAQAPEMICGTMVYGCTVVVNGSMSPMPISFCLEHPPLQGASLPVRSTSVPGGMHASSVVGTQKPSPDHRVSRGGFNSMDAEGAASVQKSDDVPNLSADATAGEIKEAMSTPGSPGTTSPATLRAMALLSPRLRNLSLYALPRCRFPSMRLLGFGVEVLLELPARHRRRIPRRSRLLQHNIFRPLFHCNLLVLRR
ncbi:hypothetical protein BDQ17DRAFT_647664 [Cyathus striatus]|nr:hypothetical protein BDQ17DRAFT_647664 [Cyathus striatus]